ncbi:MAG: TonB-dependent receptor [Acidobacteriota bacterium]
MLWLAFALLWTLPLVAQEDAAEEAEEPVAVLDTIVVTAQKREEDQRDVSVSISTLSTEQVQNITAGGGDVRTLSGRVPSVIAESSFGRAFPRFYVRGLGNTDFDLNASQPVSMLYDEVVLENPVLKGKPLFDLDRVEVLRGPQGSLFGRNTPAGAIKFETVRPSQTRDSMVRASWGMFNTSEVQAAFGGALSDTVSARLSALYQGRSDWVDNTFTGEDDALGGYTTGALRLQLLWQPNERFSGLLSVHGWDTDGTARIFRANAIETGTNRLVGGFERDEVSQDGQNTQDVEGLGGSLRLEYDFGGATLTSITAFETLEFFSRGDVDGGFGAVFAPPSGPGFIPFPAESADGIPSLDQFTQEIRVASNGDEKVDWLIGAFLFDEDLEIESFSFLSLAGGALEGLATQTQQAEAWALFGSVDFEVTDRFSVEAGLRFSNDEKDFSAERPDPTFQTPTSAPIERSTDTDFTSWDLTGTYEATDNVNVYGRVATGFRAPSIQGRILFCPDFEGGQNPATNCVSVADEEEIFSTEVGVKSELADRKVRLNASLYQYEVDGQQIIAVGGEFNTATLLNADTTDGYGFELELALAPTAEWLVTLGLSNNNTEIDDPDLTVAPCGGGCTVLDPITPDGALVDGNSLPHSPEWIFNGVVDYRKPLGRGLLLGSVDWAYHDEKQFFLYESEEFRDDSFEVGLRLGYVLASGNTEISLYGRNITDELVIRNGIDFNNITAMVNEPRTIGLEIATRF